MSIITRIVLRVMHVHRMSMGNPRQGSKSINSIKYYIILGNFRTENSETVEKCEIIHRNTLYIEFLAYEH